MATLEDQRKQLEEAIKKGNLSRTQIEDQKQRIREAELLLRRKKRPRFTPRKEREARRKVLQEQIPYAKGEVSRAEKELGIYQSQLGQSKAQLEVALKEKEYYDRARKLAFDFYGGDKRAAIVAGYFLNEGTLGRKAYRYYEKYLNYLRDKYKNVEPTPVYEINPKYKDLNYTPAELPEDYFQEILPTSYEEPTSKYGYSYEDIAYVKLGDNQFKPIKVGKEATFDLKPTNNFRIEDFLSRQSLSNEAFTQKQEILINPPNLKTTKVPPAIQIALTKQGYNQIKQVFDKIYYTKKYKSIVVFDNEGNKVLIPEGKVTRLANAIRTAKNYLGIKSLNPEDRKAVKGLSIAALFATAGAGFYAAEGLAFASQATRGLKYSTALATPRVITEPLDVVYEKIPSTEGKYGGGLKGFGTSLLLTTRFPTGGLAYGSKFAQDLALDPVGSIANMKQFASERPLEFTGILAGGSKRVKAFGESTIRRIGGQTKARVFEVEVPNYGPVKIVETPKYGKIAFIEGTFAQSEKIVIKRQLELSIRPQRFVFTSAGKQGVKLGKAGKGSGFEVIAASKPLRGLYEAPPAKFLKEAYQLTQTESNILSYYTQAGARDRLFITPTDIVSLITGKADLSPTRASALLRRSKYPKTDKWVYDTARNLSEGKGIPQNAKKIINELYNEFLREPLEWNGEIYKGEKKVKLINNTNFKGLGKGIKLKVAIALLQYQFKTGKTLVGGAEILSGILPYGPESQLVEAIGTRFYRRDIKDLRRAKGVGKVKEITDFLTGQRRGQSFTQIGPDLLELEYVRAFNKRGKTRKQREIALQDYLTRTKETRNRPKASRVRPRPTKVRVRQRDIFEEMLRPRRRERERPRERIMDRERIRERTRERARVRPRERIMDRIISRPRERPPRIRDRFRERPRVRPPRTPPRQPPRRPPFRPPRIITPQRERRVGKKKKRLIRGGPLARPLPTAFETLVTDIKRKKAAKKEYTGFEEFRFI